MVRNYRSASAKAQDALDLANRKVARLEARLAKVVETATEIKAELDLAIIAQDYAAKNPMLSDPLPGTEDVKP